MQQDTPEPVRTCVGCRRQRPQSELVRLAVDRVDGGAVIVADPRRVLPGRGAYLHADAACVATALKRRALQRALRTDAPPADGLAAALDAGAKTGDTR